MVFDDEMIKPDELHEYMKSLLEEPEKYEELLPVIVKGIIKAVQSK